MSKIIERIEREAGVPGLAEILADRLTATDLQSLLIEVFRRRSARRRPVAVMAEYLANRFVQHAAISPAVLARWEQTAYAALPPEFQPVVLSPVCPLGTNTAMADVDPKWSVATIRNTEVVSDPTNVLALECAVRRRANLSANPAGAEAVHLATSHRALRAQKYTDARFVPHFSLFALCSAGRDRQGIPFELTMLATHLQFYIRAVRAFVGWQMPMRVAVTDFDGARRRQVIEERILAGIRTAFEEVACGFDDTRTGGKGYYRGLCFHLYGMERSGVELELADGGAVEWAQRLLSDAKERLVISGIGSERVCMQLIN